MIIRASKFNFNVGLSKDQFRNLEFSKDLKNWIPDTELSCNKCRSDDATENLEFDNVLSFLAKFKANNLASPKKVLSEGLSGFIMPEGNEFDYRDTVVEKGYFRSVKTYHVNLHTTSEQLSKIADDIYGNSNSRLYYGADKVSEYLLQYLGDAEWRVLYSDRERKNWKNFVKELLHKNYFRRFGVIERENLKTQNSLDSVNLTQALRELKEFDALSPGNLEEIRIAKIVI